MKKKLIIVFVVIAVVLLLIPVRKVYEDGGTQTYTSLMTIIMLGSHCVHTWEPLSPTVLSRLRATTIYSGCTNIY